MDLRSRRSCQALRMQQRVVLFNHRRCLLQSISTEEQQQPLPSAGLSNPCSFIVRGVTLLTCTLCLSPLLSLTRRQEGQGVHVPPLPSSSHPLSLSPKQTRPMMAPYLPPSPPPILVIERRQIARILGPLKEDPCRPPPPTTYHPPALSHSPPPSLSLASACLCVSGFTPPFLLNRRMEVGREGGWQA